MTQCHECGGTMTVTPSTFPGFNLLACGDCGRPIKLIPIAGPRPRGTRASRRGDENRALRAARRMKQRQPPQP